MHCVGGGGGLARTVFLLPHSTSVSNSRHTALRLFPPQSIEITPSTHILLFIMILNGVNINRGLSRRDRCSLDPRPRSLFL